MKSILGFTPFRNFSVAAKIAQPAQSVLNPPLRKIDPSNPFLMRGRNSTDQSAFNTSGNFNVSLTHFFSLPQLEKKDCELILGEIRKDMDNSWTPSKLVQAIDKHIIS